MELEFGCFFLSSISSKRISYLYNYHRDTRVKVGDVDKSLRSGGEILSYDFGTCLSSSKLSHTRAHMVFFSSKSLFIVLQSCSSIAVFFKYNITEEKRKK